MPDFRRSEKVSSIGSPDKVVWRISDRVYVPTLDELIDACGENFGSLDERHDGWLARANGLGWVQRWGGPIEEIRPGDVICFAAGEKHWHGATPRTAMTHIAIQEALNGKPSTGWNT
jgi:hypothetical protein